MVNPEEFRKYRKRGYVDYEGVLKLCDEEIADFYLKLMSEYKFWKDGKPVNCCDCGTELTNPADMRRDGGACLCHNCLVKRRKEKCPTSKLPARMLENPTWRRFLDKITSEPIYRLLREKSVKINATPIRKKIREYSTKAYGLETERRELIKDIAQIVQNTIIPEIDLTMGGLYKIKTYKLESGTEVGGTSRNQVPSCFNVSLYVSYDGVLPIPTEIVENFNKYQKQIKKRANELERTSGLGITLIPK
jgi:hypothetical protein